MIRSLWTASTGMEAQQLRMDVIANNLANVNTPGFKRSRADFQDLLYQTLKAPGTASTAGNLLPVGIQIGHGTRTASVHRQFQQGSLQQTNQMLDIAIEGNGFFQIVLPSGETAYSRSGAFQIDSEGNLVNSEGFLLEPQITIPSAAVDVTIGSDGTITVTMDQQAQAEELGQIQLARFLNPSGLRSMGRNLYLPTDASGDAVAANPGEDGMGSLAQGYLEMSNVSLVEEMVNLITTERGYEFSSKILKASDEMLQVAARSVG